MHYPGISSTGVRRSTRPTNMLWPEPHQCQHVHLKAHCGTILCQLYPILLLENMAYWTFTRSSRRGRTYQPPILASCKRYGLYTTPGETFIGHHNQYTTTSFLPSRALQPSARHELARAIALEDGEPWRIAYATAEQHSGPAGGPIADVDRLRATPTGAARLARALAQGEVSIRLVLLSPLSARTPAGTRCFPM